MRHVKGDYARRVCGLQLGKDSGMDDPLYIDRDPPDAPSASHAYLLARLSRWHRSPASADDGSGNHPTRKAIDSAIQLVRQFAAEQTAVRWLAPATKGGVDISVPGEIVHRIDRHGEVEIVTFAGAAME